MFIKRSFDIILSLTLLPIFVLPIIIICLIIRIESSGSAIFYSKRYGKNNIIFSMPKFRTMKIGTPQLATHLLSESEKYVTRFGKILRKTSLDEIPQLYSILKGDMSFVGPRPALFNQNDLIELRKKFDIHLLTPGLTGWAQINGRDSISIDDKVQIERYYNDNYNIVLDIKILYLTLLKVVKMKNIKH